ncbi:MAG TPA: TraB/GumN family protein, partial [Chitinophagaceae bacterium]|nr:TraB/GumN family protein [Chitinophagaceae bacterium]
MPNRFLLLVLSFCTLIASGQTATRLKSKKYPSLLWEISGKGMKKPSYLFGTMHVSSKMVFHLSDSFYLAIRGADVVALETNPADWQEDMSRYDLEGGNWRRMAEQEEPEEYFTQQTLRYRPYEKRIEQALYSSPSLINSFLYRTNSDQGSDFEEDTYLDLYIFQVGRKWGKKVCGVENFDESMKLMQEAYEDAAKDKNRQRRNTDFDE